MSLYDLYLSTIELNSKGQALTDTENVEEQYLHRVVSALDKSSDFIECSYVSSRACCGGRNNTQRLLDQVCADVLDAASRTGAEVPDMYVGMWPSRAANARSAPVRGGSMCFVNSGLLQLNRLLLLQACRCLGDILGVTWYGKDQSTRERAATVMRGALDANSTDSEAWILENAGALQGTREWLRREMNYAAIASVVAHEAGHQATNRLAGAGLWKDDNGEWNTKHVDPDHPNAISEIEVGRAFGRELHADTTALTILRQPPFSLDDQVPIAVLLGVLAVQALQAGQWWRAAAFTDAPLGWTHPSPDIRGGIGGVMLAESEAELNRVLGERPLETPETEDSQAIRTRKIIAARFREWANDVFDIDGARDVVRTRGLGSRRVDPTTLAFLYSTDPQIPRQPNVLVQEVASSDGGETVIPTKKRDSGE